MKLLRLVVLLLVIIGALNWGFIAFFGMNVVEHIFGSAKHMPARLVYGLVGIAGLFSLVHLFRCMGCGCKCGSSCNCCRKK